MKIRVSIRQKLVIAYTSLIGLISLFIFIYFPASKEAEQIKALENRAEAIAEVMGSMLYPALVYEDNKLIAQETKNVGRLRDLTYAVIHDAEGQVIGEYNLPEAEKAGYTKLKSGPLAEGDYIRYAKTVTLSRKTIGYIYVGFSLNSLRSEVARTRITIALVSLVIFCLGLAAVIFISTMVTRPLNRLADSTRLIAAGDLSHRSAIRSGDEFELLSDSFDTMVGKLEQANSQLFVLNQGLEKIASEKTEDLKKEIENHKRTEKALTESEIRFRTIFEEAGMAIVLTDMGGAILESNDAFMRMMGYTEAELRMMTLQELSHPEDMKSGMLMFSMGTLDSATEGPSYTEKRYIRKDGKTVWGKLTTAIISDRSSKSSFVLVMIEDMTSRKKASDDLQKQTRLLGGAAEAANILLTTGDFNDAINGALRALGEASTVDRVYIFDNIYAKDGTPLMKQTFEWTNGLVSTEINNQMLQNSPYPDEIYTTLSGGGVFSVLTREGTRQLKEILEPQDIVSVLLVPVFVEGTYRGFIGFDDCQEERIWSKGEEAILRTIAGSIGGAIQRKEYEEELKAAKEKAVESDRLKSTLLANMSHEFRTPVNGIMGFSELLMEEFPEGKRLGMVKSIYSSGKRLMKTLNSILTYSQIESGKIHPDLQPRKLAELAESSLYPYIQQAAAKRLEFEFVINAPEIMAYTDPQLFGSALDHIMDNAVKFTKAGKITVTVEERGGHPAVAVKDTGIGIAPEHMELIFQEFRQASEGIGRSYEGSGLGLTIARKLARMMGGELSVKSEPDKGSEFVLSFMKAGWEDHLANPEQNAEQRSPVPLTRCSALLVEDDEANLQVASKYTEPLCHVDRARDGATALVMAAQKRYTLILMNINLGDGPDGIETARAIHDLPGNKDVPIIAVTGYAMQGDRARFITEGFAGYISKPYDKAAFVTEIEKQLKNYEV
ncbi:MAG: Sensor histidine kinase RcsC [Ignavibacteriaceae bacterium]|nr:Sensor histidine kinase RcsC [Ignavibacteriaceae bacterium]